MRYGDLLELPVRGTGEGAVSGAVSHEGALSSDISALLVRNTRRTKSPGIYCQFAEVDEMNAIRYSTGQFLS